MIEKDIHSIQQFFTNFLASKKLRLTSPRKIIFNELITRQTHANMDELHEAVKKQDSNIGLATMYRTLKLLTQSGLAREVQTENGKPFYEAVVGRTHHDHLTCEKCGTSVEFVDTRVEALQEEIAKKYGFILTTHELYLKGVCSECGKKRKTR